MSTSEPTVFIVDDDHAVRRFLCGLIVSIDVPVESYASARDFLDSYEPGRAGCLLLDIRMPGMSGLELQQELDRRAIDLPVIILTGHGNVQVAVNAMKAGAVDFIEKPFNNELLLDRVQRALSEGVKAREARLGQEAIRDRMARLTPRERQVLERVIAGDTNKGVARRLGISEKTVELHRSRVMEKMQAGSLATLVKMVSAVQAS
jgi:FixJ family two-component response regulator